MSATPRTLRAVTMPAAPRVQRATRLHTRPFGTMSLFLAATGILGLTSLCYLWQAGQATAAAMRIQTLTYQLQSAKNQTYQLESQVAQLTSPATVMQAASTQYDMSMPADPSTVRQISVPGPVVPRVVAVPARGAAVHLGVAGTDAAVTSWWQESWVALYKLLQ